jgi:hypothetical protein
MLSACGNAFAGVWPSPCSRLLASEAVISSSEAAAHIARPPAISARSLARRMTGAASAPPVSPGAWGSWDDEACGSAT